jgi:hypothetical protein
LVPVLLVGWIRFGEVAMQAWRDQWFSPEGEDLLPPAWIEEVKTTWAAALAALQQSLGADAPAAVATEELLQRCTAATSKTLGRLIAPFAGPQSVCEMLWSFPLEQVANFVQRVLLPCEESVGRLQEDCSNNAAVAGTIVGVIGRAKRSKEEGAAIRLRFQATVSRAVAIKHAYDLSAIAAKHAEDSDKPNKQIQLERQLEEVQKAVGENDKALKELLALAEFYPECLQEIPPEKLRTQQLTTMGRFLQFASLERSFDTYRNVERLAAESNHLLFRAKYNGKECVLKQFDLTKDSNALFREADILRRLYHPNIVELQCLFLCQEREGLRGMGGDDPAVERRAVPAVCMPVCACCVCACVCVCLCVCRVCSCGALGTCWCCVGVAGALRCAWRRGACRADSVLPMVYRVPAAALLPHRGFGRVAGSGNRRAD